MRVEIDVAAEKDVLEIIDWYDFRSSTAGEMFVNEFHAALYHIAAFPKAYPKVSRRARRFRMSKFPYGLVYQISKSEIVVVAVTHLHRKPGYWKSRLK
jgi:plasmid stabilization system protein ParE